MRGDIIEGRLLAIITTSLQLEISWRWPVPHKLGQDASENIPADPPAGLRPGPGLRPGSREQRQPEPARWKSKRNTQSGRQTQRGASGWWVASTETSKALMSTLWDLTISPPFLFFSQLSRKCKNHLENLIGWRPTFSGQDPEAVSDLSFQVRSSSILYSIHSWASLQSVWYSPIVKIPGCGV